MGWTPPKDQVVTSSGWTPPPDQVVSSQSNGKGLFRRVAESVINSPALPIAGSIAGGIAGLPGVPVTGGMSSIGGAALGGAAGESYRQLGARALGLPSPDSSADAAKKIGIEGAISGATEGALKVAGVAAKPFAEPISNALSKAGKTGARVVESFTGVKVPDVLQAAKQGLKTYVAPGMERAQEIFGNALEKTGIKARPPLKQILDPQLGVARKIALEIGQKLEAEAPVTAEEALRARQAVDRIYAATPLADRATRGHLLDLRSAFDTALSNESGALAEASKIYRQAIVKSNILNPIRITKQGQLSAVPAILGATAGSIVGTKNRSPLEGFGTAATSLAATSPALWGAGITTAADLARLAASPTSKRLLIQAAARAYLKRSGKQE